MKPSELLRHVAETAERLGITYRVVGSVATIAYGEIRYTNDIDIVVDLKASQVAAFCAAFPEPDFYCSSAAAAQAVAARFQFNLLHLSSGFKIDVIIPSGSAHDQIQLQRGGRTQVWSEVEAWFASPEDVILKKLEYFREGGSDKHIRDIIGVIKTQAERLDRAYLADWAERLNVADLWAECLRRAGGAPP